MEEAVKTKMKTHLSQAVSDEMKALFLFGAIHFVSMFMFETR